MENIFDNFSIKETRDIFGKTKGYRVDLNETEVGVIIAAGLTAVGYFVYKQFKKAGEKR